MLILLACFLNRWQSGDLRIYADVLDGKAYIIIAIRPVWGLMPL
jgi:hypothetical protein